MILCSCSYGKHISTERMRIPKQSIREKIFLKKNKTSCLHVAVTVLRTPSVISFSPSDKFFYFFSKFRRIICTIFLSNK